MSGTPSAPPVDGRKPSQREIDIAKQILTASGYVVVKASSYAKAQERQRMADVMAKDARERAESQDRWWRESILPELFTYRDRVTFLYGAARTAGCTPEELVGVGRNDGRNQMSSDVVERAKAALEGVSEGPWEFEMRERRVWLADCDLGADIALHHQADENGRFIAESRSLIPELLQEIERLRNVASP